LRGRPLADAEYYEQARWLKQQIVDLVEQPAQHLGVRQVQGIFRNNAHRLYHWGKTGWSRPRTTELNARCAPR
jgi:transposase